MDTAVLTSLAGDNGGERREAGTVAEGGMGTRETKIRGRCFFAFCFK